MFFSFARQGNFTWAIRIFGFLVLTSAFGISPSFAQPQATESAVPSIPILVSDFELFSLPAAAAPATPPTTATATPAATPIATPPTSQAATPSKQKLPLPLVGGDPNLPSVQARRLTDFFTATLLEILQKKGYNATRESGQNPSSGAMIRGVFAETDAKNRIRRTLWGGNSTNSRFFLYVGIFNLARPDQPLYEPASEQPASSQYGPIITLNNYIPLAKYELDKNPSEEDVRKICAQIAASLTALLAANPSAFAQ